MNGLSTNLLHPAAWALVHFLWQGAAVALLVAGALAALRRRSSQARYAAALVGLALMAVLPAATTCYLASPSTVVTLASPAQVLDAPLQTAPAAASSTALAASSLDFGALRRGMEPALPWLLAAWLAGVALLTLAHFGGWRRVRRLRRDTRPVEERWRLALERVASRLGVARTVELLEAARLEAPVVVGWLKPAILLPASALAGLAPYQLEAILAHELAHVRRHDYLVNVFQLMIETLLFYHPAVWWVSHQVRAERENCCDDLAVGLSGSPVTYARALADLEGLRTTPALALGAGDGSLLARIRRLLGREAERRSPAAALAAAAVAVLGAGLLLHASPTTAAPAPDEPQDVQAQEDQKPGNDFVYFWDQDEVAWFGEEGGDEGAREENENSWEENENSWEENENSWEENENSWEENENSWEGDGEDWDDDQWMEEEAAELREDLQGTPYARLSDADLKKLVRYGLDGDDLQDFVAAGYDDLSGEELAALAKMGIDGEEIQDYAKAGYGEASVDDLIRMAKMGVDGEDLHDYAAAGYPSLSVDDIVSLAKMGVDGEDLHDYAAAGYPNLSVADILAFAKFGIDGEDVHDYAAAGYPSLSVGELVELAKFGLDGEDLHDYAAAGFTGLAVEELVKLAKMGVDGEDLEDYVRSGYADLSVDDVLSLAKMGVDGEDLQDLRQAGHDLTIEEILDRARHGELDELLD